MHMKQGGGSSTRAAPPTAPARLSKAVIKGKSLKGAMVMPAMKKAAVIKGKKLKAKAGVESTKVSSADIRKQPLCVLKATDKVSNASLPVQTRVLACHGKAVQDVVNSLIMGAKYKITDLVYDIKGGRLVALPPRSSAGPAPKAKPRPDAPCAGKPLPPASVDEFFNFLQGQLKMEIKEETGKDITLHSKAASDMWPDVQAFVTPNLGKTERWVPYHTVLGVHEKFLVEAVHNSKAHGWSEKQRFLAMFVFRAHCKCDLFKEAQMKEMSKPSFWNNPVKAFEPDGPMEKAILEYRKKTGNPLLTSCFRIIPERELKDDDRNLVRSIVRRSQRLLAVAERAFPVVKDKKKTPFEKMSSISTMIQEEQGLGETWAKMLTVCIDLAYPAEHLLASQCDVGVGAMAPMRCLLPGGGPSDRREALRDLLKMANSSKSDATKQFWRVLKESETILRAHFKNLPLIHAQAKTEQGKLSACTLQVQLCEYRQFRHSVARNKYGLPDDESMRCEPESENGTRNIDDSVFLNEKTACAWFEHRDGEQGKSTEFEVPFKLTRGNRPVAKRMAAMCLKKLRAGESLGTVKKFLDDLAKTYKPAEDVPEDHPSWRVCKADSKNGATAFDFEPEGGEKVHFQTTVGAAGGFLEAERIARLCWARLEKGYSKEDTIEYRNRLYQKGGGASGSGPGPAKRAGSGGGSHAGAPRAKVAKR